MRRRTFLTSAGLLATASLTAGCGGTGSAGDPDKVTVYSVDGLANWYGPQFKAFTKQTGIDVELVESGSAEVVSRLRQEKANTQADVAITLPPYIHKAAADGLLAKHRLPGAEHTTGGTDTFTALVNNYLCFVYNPAKADPPPSTWDDLLEPRFKAKLQYSTPGQAGDGTAVLIQLQHLYGKKGALDYLRKLEESNVGPSSSTGKLQPKVSKGELYVANGDIQMNLDSIHNAGSKFEIFFPESQGERSTFALPYFMGLAEGAPRPDNAKKLLEFLLSKPAQEQVSEQAYGIPARSDVKPSDDNYKAATDLIKDVDIWEPDWNEIVRELDADIDDYTEAIG